ncbi:MAG: ribonuclease Y [Patescibacteria group bacterium]
MFQGILSKLSKLVKADKKTVKKTVKHLPPASPVVKTQLARAPVIKAKKKKKLATKRLPDLPVAPIVKPIDSARWEELKKREQELNQRSESVARKEGELRRLELDLENQTKTLSEKTVRVDQLEKDRQVKIEELSGLGADEAKKLVVDRVEKQMATWVARKVEEANEAIKGQSEETAKEVFLESIRHGAVDWVAEYTVSTITLANEEIKGRIIGREGRNIRAFERATGVELELDETLDIRLSSFDSVRREVAKLALQKLIRDGRIQPSKIEQVVAQTQSQMDQMLLEEGKKISQSLGVYHLPVELIKLIGRFKYRFSMGQNLAQHTLEVTQIAVALAQELNLDVKTVRLGGLLHDIGKVITDEEGSHVQLGVDLLKRHRIPQAVIDTVAQHHEDEPFSSFESVAVYVGDASSGSRPGARYEAHEQYLKRMTNIEEIAKSFEGVSRVAAYQAGREVRVMVKPDDISDDGLKALVHSMAEKLDEEAKWAGQIKITAIRETRVSATAPLAVDNTKKAH